MTSPSALLAVILFGVIAVLLSSQPALASDADPRLLFASSISGCEPSAKNPNTTINCPYATPTTLTVTGTGYAAYAPDNFTLCLGVYKVTVPFDGRILNDSTLTFTTTPDMYVQTTMTKWGDTWLSVLLGGGKGYQCHGGRVYTEFYVNMPTPQVTAVTGCTNAGTGTLNCTQSDSLTFHGSGFVTFTRTEQDVIVVAEPPFNREWSCSGRVMDDKTVVIPLSRCTSTEWLVPYEVTSVYLLFDRSNPTPMIWGNGTVDISVMPAPQVIAVIGCNDTASSNNNNNNNALTSYNCTQADSLTVYGSGFTTYANPSTARVVAGWPYQWECCGTTLNDTTIVVESITAESNCVGVQPPPYATVIFSVQFDANVTSNGAVSVSLTPTGVSNSTAGSRSCFATRAVGGTESESRALGFSTGAVVGVVAAVVLVVLLTALLYRRHTQRAKQSTGPYTGRESMLSNEETSSGI